MTDSTDAVRCTCTPDRCPPDCPCHAETAPCARQDAQNGADGAREHRTPASTPSGRTEAPPAEPPHRDDEPPAAAYDRCTRAVLTAVKPYLDRLTAAEQELARRDAAAPEPAPDREQLRQQYADAIRRWWDTDDGGAEEIADAVLAVRDTDMEATEAEMVRRGETITRLEGKLEQARAERDGAYRERAHLAAHLAALHPSHIGHTDPNAPDWAVVIVETPAGQMSWHIAERDMDLFGHVMPTNRICRGWDGHTTDEKYARLRQLTATTRRLPLDGAEQPADNPPGSTREQLPAHLLAAIDMPPYTSTACQTADALLEAMPAHLDLADELSQWADRMHARCRLNHKFTGQLCQGDCHQREADRA